MKKELRSILLVCAYVVALFLIYTWMVNQSKTLIPAIALLAGCILETLRAYIVKREKDNFSWAFPVFFVILIIFIFNSYLLFQTDSSNQDVTITTKVEGSIVAPVDTTAIAKIDSTKIPPHTPSFEPGEVCNLNILELQRVANSSWRAKTFNTPPTYNTPSTKQLGTDVFRIAGRFLDTGQVKLEEDEIVLSMLRNTDLSFKKGMAAFLLKFKNKELLQKLKLHDFYEVTGKLVLNSEYDDDKRSKEDGSSLFIAYLEVSDIKKIRPIKNALIEKPAYKPPFKPTPVEYIVE